MIRFEFLKSVGSEKKGSIKLLPSLTANYYQSIGIGRILKEVKEVKTKVKKEK